MRKIPNIPRQRLRRTPPSKGEFCIRFRGKYFPFEGDVTFMCDGGCWDVPLILFKKHNLKTPASFSILKNLCNNLYISILNESEPCHNTNLQRDREYREDGTQGFFTEARLPFIDSG